MRSGFIRGGKSQRNNRDEEFKAREADDAKAHRRWSATKKSEVYGVSTLSNPYETTSRRLSLMKPIKAPSHRRLMKPLFKDKEFRRRIESGVQRLKVISQIVALREKLGLTQRELARRIGVSQPFIARLENDETSNLSLETLVKIVEALNGEVEICIRPAKKAA